MFISPCLNTPSLLAGGNIFPQVLPWLGLLLLLVLGGAVILMALRRSLRRRENGGGGYTLHDLREMRAAGELSEEEFERARQSIIDRVKAARSENEVEESPEKGPPTDS